MHPAAPRRKLQTADRLPGGSHDGDLEIGENQVDAQARKGLEKIILGFAARAGLAVFFIVQSLAPGAFAKENGANEACALKGASHAGVAAIDERLELTLADGRVLRIAGVEAAGPTPNDPDLGMRARDWLAAWLESRDISYQALDARPDRWGRIAALVFASPVSGDANLSSAAESLVQQGFARVAPDQYKNPCEKRLLKAEKAARAAVLGLWSDPYY